MKKLQQLQVRGQQGTDWTESTCITQTMVMNPRPCLQKCRRPLLSKGGSSGSEKDVCVDRCGIKLEYTEGGVDDGSDTEGGVDDGSE